MYPGDDFLSKAVQLLSIVSSFKHELGRQEDGKDCFNKEVKRSSTVRQKRVSVETQSFHWELIMWDTTWNLVHAYEQC